MGFQIEQLPNRLGSVPVQQFQAQPAPQVYPIGDIIKNGVDNLNHILDTFGPLNKAEREAKLSQSMYLKLAYDAGAKGDPSLLQQIYGHQDQTRETPEEAYRRTYAQSKGAYDARPKPPSNTASIIGDAAAKAIAAAKKAKGLGIVKSPFNNDKPAINLAPSNPSPQGPASFGLDNTITD
jgi:hypothetical protein